MSASRSQTPTQKISNTSDITPESTILLRPDPNEHPSPIPASEIQQFPSQPLPATPPLPASSPPPIETETMANLPRTRPAEETPSDQPAAKRLRRQLKDEKRRADAQSSPSSSSQGMHDSEMDADRSQQSEEVSLSTVPPPPKKKRTRTLTTPHQSAVLHALLAQVCLVPIW
jgi:type IV secretory pathway VirB10-like protein